MSQVDASIPLQVQQFKAPDLIGTQRQAYALKEQVDADQERQRNIQTQKALSEAFQGSDLSTSEGRQTAIKKIGSVNPQAAMGLQKQLTDQDKAKAETYKANAQGKAAEATAEKAAYDTQSHQLETVNSTVVGVNTYYNDLINKGVDAKQAAAQTEPMYQQALESLREQKKPDGSPLYPLDMLRKLPPTFDPQAVQAGIAGSKAGLDARKQQLAEQRQQEVERANAARDERLARIASGAQEGGKAPSGYRFTPDKTLEPIPGGPADPATKEGKLGNRESVFLNRIMISANEAAQDLENVVKLPATASTGIFGTRDKSGGGLLTAGKESLTNAMTSQEVQSYNVLSAGFQRALAGIESAGLAPSGSLSHQMDAVLFKEGDTQLTKLQKLAQTRQIVLAGLESQMSNPRIPKEQIKHMEDVAKRIEKAVPFTNGDIIDLQNAQEKNPKTTLSDILKQKKEQMKKEEKTAIPKADEDLINKYLK